MKYPPQCRSVLSRRTGSCWGMDYCCPPHAYCMMEVFSSGMFRKNSGRVGKLSILSSLNRQYLGQVSTYFIHVWLSLTFILRRNSAFRYRKNASPATFSHTFVFDQPGDPAWRHGYGNLVLIIQRSDSQNPQRNACSTYNLLTEEGRRISAALLPLTPQGWRKLQKSWNPMSIRRW